MYLCWLWFELGLVLLFLYQTLSQCYRKLDRLSKQVASVILRFSTVQSDWSWILITFSKHCLIRIVFIANTLNFKKYSISWYFTPMTPPSLVSHWCVFWRNGQCSFFFFSSEQLYLTGCDWQYCLTPDHPEVAPMIQDPRFLPSTLWTDTSPSSRCSRPCPPWRLKG